MSKRQGLNIKDLNATLVEFQERYPTLLDDDLFVLWFLRSYISESETEAADALAGGARDKNIDAILVDDAAKAVFVIQGKYRKTLGAKSETRSDILGFADVAHRVCDPSDSSFKQYTDSMDGLTADKLKVARRKVQSKGYRLRLFFVTLGKVSPDQRNDAKSSVRRAKCDSAIEIIDAEQCMVIFGDYLDGVAPPIPTLDLEMEVNPNVRVNGVANRFDGDSGIESWVFSMRGDAIASLYDMAGIRLFARNVRGFLGSTTAVNDGLLQTRQTDACRLFY